LAELDEEALERLLDVFVSRYGEDLVDLFIVKYGEKLSQRETVSKKQLSTAIRKVFRHGVVNPRYDAALRILEFVIKNGPSSFSEIQTGAKRPKVLSPTTVNDALSSYIGLGMIKKERGKYEASEELKVLRKFL
jgi:hypothetical protein